MFTRNPQELAEAKLLLLYIINNIKVEISNSQLTQIILENDIMNYFVFQQYLSELVASQFLEENNIDNNPILLITDMGRDTLNYFINRIPESQLEFIDGILNIERKKIIENTEVTADYIRLEDNSYLVMLRVVENDLPIINLELSVANNKQAKDICAKWKNDASHFYSQIINMLISYDQKEGQN